MYRKMKNFSSKLLSDQLALETKLMEEQLVKLRQELARDKEERDKIKSKESIWKSARKAWQTNSSLSTRDNFQQVKQPNSSKAKAWLFNSNKSQSRYSEPNYATDVARDSVYEELKPMSAAFKKDSLAAIASKSQQEEDENEYDTLSNQNTGGALWGTYDEEEAKSSFQEALLAWRTGNSNSNTGINSNKNSAREHKDIAEVEIQTKNSRDIKKTHILPEQFSQKLKDCLRTSYFDVLEEKLQKVTNH
jgi:hypothetical protein